MTIARNPKKKSDRKAERDASKFIGGSADGAGGRDLVPVLMKFDRAFLGRLDAMAGMRGLSRTAYVIATLGAELYKQ